MTQLLNKVISSNSTLLVHKQESSIQIYEYMVAILIQITKRLIPNGGILGQEESIFYLIGYYINNK